MDAITVRITQSADLTCGCRDFPISSLKSLTAVRRSLHISGKKLESREKILTVNKNDVTGVKQKVRNGAKHGNDMDR